MQMETNGYPNDAHDDFDLAQFDDDFAGAPVEEKEFEEPPDGKYQVLVDKVEMTRSKERNLPMLKWQLRILGPRCAGRFLFRNNMIASPENVKWLKNDLATCGMDVGELKLSDLPNRLGELLDVTLEVQKKTNGEYTNVYLNRRIQIDVPPEHAAGRASGGSDDVLPF
jgi:hypothetical protein